MFRAYDPERDRLVAVKLFRLDMVPERVHQLAAELDVLIEAQLTHPVIAAPLAAGITGVSAYLGMEFVAADSLDLVLRDEGPSQVDHALRLAAKLASALDFAAEAGIYHGALHPRDVLVSAEATRLTGLGIAQALERAGSTVPLRRPYTAPERTASGRWDARADVFGLAMIVHELIWGRRLAGAGAQAASSIAEIEGGDLVQLQDVFARALAENPDDRFDSAGAFVEALSASFVAVEAPAPIAKSLRRAAVPLLDAPEDVPLPLDELPAGTVAPPIQPGNLLNLGAPVSLDSDDLSVPADLIEPREELPELDFVDTVSLERASLQEFESPRTESIESPHALEVDVSPETVASLEPESTSLRPLALALILGIAIGFAAGFPLGFRIQPASQDARAGAPEPSVPIADPVDAPLAANVPAAPLLSVAPPVADFPPAAPDPEPAAPKRAEPVVEPVDVPSGAISVRSTPSGARVLVDGRDVGRTPLTTKNISHGAHQVRVVRDGYDVFEKRVLVSAGKPSQSVSAALTKSRPPAPAQARAPQPVPAPKSTEPGSLGVESRPVGANVFVDGKLVGTTPLLLASVTPGEHAVRLELVGHRDWVASVNVVAGERRRVAASLEP